MTDIVSKKDWHIEKSVSVGHLLTTVVIIIGMLTYFGEQDKRISSNELSIEFMKSQRTEDLRRIEKRLDSIDDKLNQIIDAKNTR